MFSIPPTIAEASFDLKGFHTLYSTFSPVSLFYIDIRNTLFAIRKAKEITTYINRNSLLIVDTLSSSEVLSK